MIAILKGAGKQYKSGDQTIVALQPTDLVLNEGELLLIMGPSGSGKTTLLSLLGCVIYPSFGDLWVDGKQVNKLKPRELAALRLNAIGFVFQNFNLLAPLSAEDNVAMPLKLQGVARKERKQRVNYALELVGMTDRRKNLPKQLSGGQQQRIAIARAIAKRPSVLLCDEPTGALDSATGIRVLEAIETINSTLGTTTVVITHNADIARMAHRVLQLGDGRIVGEKINAERVPASELTW